MIQSPPVLTCGSSQLTLPAFTCQAKKTQEKEAVSKPQKAETKPNESCQPTPPAAQEGNANVSKTNTTGGKREGRVQRRSRKWHAVAAITPPEGSSNKELEQTK